MPSDQRCNSGFRAACHVKIAGFGHQEKIAPKKRSRPGVGAKARVFAGCQQKKARGKAGEKNEDKWRQDAQDAALVKLLEAEIAAGNILEDDICNQVAGNDKENIHAKDPESELAGPGVKKHDGKHSKGAQAVHIGPVIPGLEKTFDKFHDLFLIANVQSCNARV